MVVNLQSKLLSRRGTWVPGTGKAPVQAIASKDISIKVKEYHPLSLIVFEERMMPVA